MRPKPPTNYLAGYPLELADQVRQMIEQEKIADWLLKKIPEQPHRAQRQGAV